MEGKKILIGLILVGISYIVLFEPFFTTFIQNMLITNFNYSELSASWWITERFFFILTVFGIMGIYGIFNILGGLFE
jgi:hypothetical protein